MSRVVLRYACQSPIAPWQRRSDITHIRSRAQRFVANGDLLGKWVGDLLPTPNLTGHFQRGWVLPTYHYPKRLSKLCIPDMSVRRPYSNAIIVYHGFSGLRLLHVDVKIFSIAVLLLFLLSIFLHYLSIIRLAFFM